MNKQYRVAMTNFVPQITDPFKVAKLIPALLCLVN